MLTFKSARQGYCASSVRSHWTRQIFHVGINRRAGERRCASVPETVNTVVLLMPSGSPPGVL